MAFIVEDGTGLTDSNSFGAVVDADFYFADRGNAAWTGSDTLKEQALVRATDYLNNRFKFLGWKYNEEQALEFPRQYTYGGDAEMPPKLLQATYEYAVRALTATLAPDVTVDDRGLQVTSKTEIVGPIEESTTYSEGGSIMQFRPYPAADMLLRGLVDNVRRVVR